MWDLYELFLVSTKREEMGFLSMFKYERKKGQHTTANTAYKTEHVIKQGSKNNRQMNWRVEKFIQLDSKIVIKADPFSRFPRDCVKNNSQYLKKKETSQVWNPVSLGIFALLIQSFIFKVVTS